MNHMTGRENIVAKLKAKIMKKGRKEMFALTGVFMETATEKEVNEIMDSTFQHMSREMLYKVLNKYGLMPRYKYSGPIPSPLADGDRDSAADWVNYEAYKQGLTKTPTGSITIEHPDITMMCRVTDDPFLPGFIITCKDNEGSRREFHIYFNGGDGPRITVCTDNATNGCLKDEDTIRRNYSLPFKNE